MLNEESGNVRRITTQLRDFCHANRNRQRARPNPKKVDSHTTTTRNKEGHQDAHQLQSTSSQLLNRELSPPRRALPRTGSAEPQNYFFGEAI